MRLILEILRYVWWHDTQPISTLLALCKENPPVQSKVMGSFYFSFVVSLNKLLDKLLVCRWFTRPLRERGFTAAMACIKQSMQNTMVSWLPLTHWGRVRHICVSKLTIIGPDKDLSPGRRQAIIWTIVNSDLRNKLQLNFKPPNGVTLTVVTHNKTQLSADNDQEHDLSDILTHWSPNTIFHAMFSSAFCWKNYVS